MYFDHLISPINISVLFSRLELTERNSSQQYHYGTDPNPDFDVALTYRGTYNRAKTINVDDIPKPISPDCLSMVIVLNPMFNCTGRDAPR